MGRKKSSSLRICIAFLGAVILSACIPQQTAYSPTATETISQSLAADNTEPAPTKAAASAPTHTISPSQTAAPSSTPTKPGPSPTPTEDLRLPPQQWHNWPIVPELSRGAYQLYQQGLQNGNHAQRFSVIGDCQSEPEVFLGIYETDRYWLSDDYAHLQESIDYYYGSFSHESFSVKGGMSASTALSPLWADQDHCENLENPVQCELRHYKPSIVFINLGTNWRADASTVPYEKYLREVVKIVVENGTLPILMTKADNVEADHSINLITAKVAYDYDVPMLNFWLAAQSLEHNGLDENKNFIYLTPAGWDRRNFVALRTLDAIHRQIEAYDGDNK